MVDLFNFDDEIKDDIDLSELEEIDVKYGDIFEIGNHRVMCGDATKEEDVEKLIDNNVIDIAFTDPPYNVKYTGGIQVKDGKFTKNNRQMIMNDDIDIYKSVFYILNKYVEGACYIWFSDSKAESVYINANKYGKIHANIIWVKNGGYGALNANYKQKHEPCLYWKPKNKTLKWSGNTSETTIWYINKDISNNYHPTQKPVELVVKALNNHNANTVLDLFGGSGSTLIGCQLTKRKGFIMELDPQYVKVILNRYYVTFGKKAVKVKYTHNK